MDLKKYKNRNYYLHSVQFDYTSVQKNLNNSTSESKSRLRRTSINVSDIDDPRNILSRTTQRRSIRAIETNDIVPKLKLLVPSDEAISNLIQIVPSIGIQLRHSSTDSTSSSTYSYSSTDSSTPSFVSVILIFEDDKNVISSGNIDKREARMSKFLYHKANLKVVDLAASEDTASVGLLSDSLSIREDNVVYGNALDILKKYNIGTRKSTNDLIDDKSTCNLNSRLKGSFSFPNCISVPSAENIIPLENVEHNSKTNGLEFKRLSSDQILSVDHKIIDTTSESQVKINCFTTTIVEKRVSRLIDRQLKSQMSESGVTNNIPIHKAVTNNIGKIEVQKNEMKSNQGIKSAKKNKQRIFKEYMTKGVCKIPIFTKSEILKKSQGILLKEIDNLENKQLKMIQENKSFIYPNMVSILCNKVPFRSLSLQKLLLTDDIIVIKRQTIVNLNDIPDAIASTLIFRDLGINMISETLLIRHATTMVKLKSQNLKFYLCKEFPILQKSIYNMIHCRDYENGSCSVYKSKSRLPIKLLNEEIQLKKSSGFDCVLSLTSLIKKLHFSYYKAYKFQKTANSISFREKTDQVKNTNPYQDDLKMVLESLKVFK